MKAQVFVTLKPQVLDPQGKAVANALRSLGFPEVADVRVGKYITIEMSGGPEGAEARIRTMCEKLLANPVMETFRCEVKED